MANSIVVIGSLNMDFVLAVERLPLPGETILGHNFRTIPGGKGANQAYAAAKLAGGGTVVRMIGRVGSRLVRDGAQSKIWRAWAWMFAAVLETDAEATGVACIHVDDAGQNSITVAPGANGVLSAVDIYSERWALEGARCVLLQLEVPMDSGGGRLAGSAACGRHQYPGPCARARSAQGDPRTGGHRDAERE